MERDNEKLVEEFGKHMLKKLNENNHKTHWRHCEVEYLVDRLVQESDELFTAIEDEHSPEEIIRECADVANFAAMIADMYTKPEVSHG